MTTIGPQWAPGVRARLYPELAFGGYSRRDGTIAFYTRAMALTTPASRVLDYGCGTGAHVAASPPFTQAARQFRGRVAEVIGADVDESAADNPYVDRFLLIHGGRVPIEQGSVDVCICDWTLEHLPDVTVFFAECQRLLRPGGYLCLRTPNQLHYSSLGARVVPFKYHHALRRWLGQFHTDADVFPIYYRCNTRSRLRAALGRHGFESVVYTYRGESHLAGAGPLLGRA